MNGFNMQHFISTSNKILKDPNSEKGLKTIIMLDFSDSQYFHEPQQQKVVGPLEATRYFQPQFNGSSLLEGN